MKKIIIVLAALLALLLGLWAQHSLKVDFTATDGNEYRWSSGEGKWKVVNYFAEWCAPCLREMPELNRFYQLHKDEIDIFAVSFDPLDNEQLIVLKRKYDIQFAVVASLNSIPWNQPPKSLPTTYILDAKGNVQQQLKGEQSAQKLIQTINKLKGL